MHNFFIQASDGSPSSFFWSQDLNTDFFCVGSKKYSNTTSNVLRFNKIGSFALDHT